jgi:hypothetical protein
MRSLILMSLLMFGCYINVVAQEDTSKVSSAKQERFLPKVIIPAVLITTGALLSGSETEKGWQLDVRNKVGHDYHNGVDDYIQYVPFVQIYLGDWVGIDAKNHWFDRTKNIFIGGVITTVITHSLKRGVGKERPDGSSNHSFSSGHTAASFLGATLLYHEYKDSSKLYAFSGYAFSTSTGGFRVLNNRHWVSDVVAGAGIGILVANLVYHFEPLKNWNPFKKNNNLTFTPMVNGEEVTFVASIQF